MSKMTDGALFRIGGTTIGSIVIGAAIGDCFSTAMCFGLALALGSVGLVVSVREAKQCG